MKFLTEFRDKYKIDIVVKNIHALDRREMKIMEVCGSQTHTIMKYGLEDLLPENITMIHGPGCPVCVTPVEMIDKAIKLAGINDIILVTYGDMMRVPGSEFSLLDIKAEGADIRIIHSPLDAVRIAQNSPGKNVVFFAIGFETTAPANASAVIMAEQAGLKNFYIISSQVLIPPAVELIMSSGDIKLNGLLAPGHVCSVTGSGWCREISTKFKVPVTITGFEPLDILEGILQTAGQIISGHREVKNQYSRVVRDEGNPAARLRMDSVFKKSGRNWRGIGFIPGGGLDLKESYERFDAVKAFGLADEEKPAESGCISGEILKGIKKPYECPLFGRECNPENPVGAPMVSSEGACAAYYIYRQVKVL